MAHPMWPRAWRIGLPALIGPGPTPLACQAGAYGLPCAEPSDRSRRARIAARFRGRGPDVTAKNDDARIENDRGPEGLGGTASDDERPGEEETQDPRARVEEIDKRLAELRATLDNRPDGPGDQVDAATALSLREEILMMVETLENEKRRLLEHRQGR